ncbi:DNA polymerase III delta prime subunit [Acidisarcina polymorpha]|uniref:DNA polymerase III delta prime subunit n=1 Tax=Acidisarcina polymorpha TaxID=2211140 RepID=A0A2Z5G0E0_9BACT|nr:DNA polymerase III subunit delta' [Acidisarcina polymorpha]AXC12562.1 DNA polymerase III delta prime subunit [Acidisarcina polymorpha]
MGFSNFLGNEAVVQQLRRSILSGRLPQAMILAGPSGAGKYTLAVMLAQAANCTDPSELEARQPGELPDFCGVCPNCVRIGAAAPLRARFDEAVSAREELREVDKKETRILIQTHPDVLVVPPDPPQLLIKLGQVRRVIHEMYRFPSEAKRAFYIFTSTRFMKEAANSLLKVLEEPPEFATIVLLAENPGELLPTIRSRTSLFTLGALPLEALEGILAAQRAEWKPSQRSLVARLAEGAIGRALAFPLERYLASRQDALVLVRGAIAGPDYSVLFRMTETYRSGAEGQEKMVDLNRALMSLLEDLMLLLAGAPQLVRNIDLTAELAKLAAAVDLQWVERTAGGVVQLESGLRRNLLRSLALDAFANEFVR